MRKLHRCFHYFCLLLTCICGKVAAQEIFLSINPIDATIRSLSDSLHLKTKFANHLLCSQYVQQLPGLLQGQGFLTASIDSSSELKDTTSITLFLGRKYTWEQIFFAEKDKPLLNLLSIKEEWFKEKPVTVQQIRLLQNKLLDYFLSNGYPFASVQFDSVHLKGNKVDAQLSIKKGLPYKLDSIRILGSANISINFLYRYLGMLPGSLFSIEKLNKITQLLQQLPYLQQSKPWDITMLGSSYLLNLYLQPKRSNQINVLVGFQPANSAIYNKVLLTGDAEVNLKNSFGVGETIGLNWQQLQAASPRLNLVYLKPYLFNTIYGADLGFDLYKKDSSYINITTKIGLQYLATPKKTGTISLQSFSTNILYVDTASIIANKALPNIVDVRNTSLVLEYKVDNTNYHPNPQRGNEYYISLAAGNKMIKKNSTIVQLQDTSGFNYSSLYDTVQLNSYQLKINGVFAYYLPFGRQSVFKTALNGGWLESPNFFTNELFQIGGTKLLRGFDEGSIYANRYAVFTGEYRYLVGTNSYFNGLVDVGFTKNSVTNTNNSFLGTGIGLAFEAKQGILNISLAVGKSNVAPLNLNQAKIHIGFVSIF